MTIRGGGDPNPRMALRPPCRMGPPLRSSAADAYYCIMVQIPRIYRIQVCGAMLRAQLASAPQIVPETRRMPNRAAWRDLALDGNVPIKVVGHRAAAAALHRQPRLGAVERLDLRLLIDRQHQRVLGRIDIEADDVLDLGGKLRIVGQLERSHPVRLEAVRRPDPLYAVMADTGGFRHRPAG